MRPRDAEKEMAAANPVDRERAAGLPLSPGEDELVDAILAEPPERSPVAPARSGAFARRGPRLALGGGVAAAAVAAALVVGAGGDNPPAAFAVEPQEGGGVTIEIYSLRDPEGVEKALEEAGIASQVNFLEPGMTCREPHYQPSMALVRTLQDNQPQPQPWAGFDYESNEGPLVISIGDYQQRRELDEDLREAVREGTYSAGDSPDFVVDPTGIRPDQTLIMTSSPTPPGYEQPVVPGGFEGEIERIGPPIDTVGQVRVAEGEVEPCDPVPAPEGIAPIRAPEGGWDFSQVPYAGWGFGFPFGGAK